MDGGSQRTRRVFDEAFSGTSSSLVWVRAAVGAAAEAIGLDQDASDRLKLVANELATNAVDASPGAEFHLAVEAEADGEVAIRVRSKSTPSDLPARSEWGPTELLAKRGRGLAIVDAVAESVEVSQPAEDWLEIIARVKPVPSAD